MQLPSVKKRAVAQGLSVSFQGGIHGVANVCKVGSDVITKPKFLALMGLPKSFGYGAPLARALRRARELRYNGKLLVDISTNFLQSGSPHFSPVRSVMHSQIHQRKFISSPLPRY